METTSHNFPENPVIVFHPKTVKASENGIDLITKILNIIRNKIRVGSKFIYRGVSKDFTPKVIQSGAAVRLDRSEATWNYSTYLAYIRGLITEVKRNYPETYSNWTDLEILGDLQHNGAGTCLIDFSRNLLISLWFACGETEDNKDGILYCYDVNDDLIKRNSLKVIKETDLNKPIENLLVETKHVTNFCSVTEYSFFMWTPSNLNNRIARQDSVFIFGLPKFRIREHSVLEIVIPTKCKSKIREALQFYFDVNDASIFNDRHGFATVNDKLTPFPKKENNYEQGCEEMHKGNYKIALDFFIMYENDLKKGSENNSDPEIIISIAELHLSKALCYKYLYNDNKKESSYADNAIYEYKKARELYSSALDKVDNSNQVWVEVYSRKLLRTSNDVIQLLYNKKDYQKCIYACDIAKDFIEKVNTKIHEKKRYKDIYCRLSKLEIHLLMYFEQENNMERVSTKRSEKDWEIEWKKDWVRNWRKDWRKDWEKEGEEEGEEELKKELNNTLDELNGTKGNGSNNIINIESEFDKMLFCYFTLIGMSIFENDENESEIWENITTRFREGTNHTFNNKKSDKVPYSSWDFTKTYTAISNTKKLNDSIKSELIELTAHMISIRDKYNIRELNAPLEPQKQ